MLDPNRIVQAMVNRNYPLAIGDDQMNLIYVEGMETTGLPNGNRPNCWDDIRTLVRVHPNMQAELLGAWEATTEPGEYWTDNPMNAAGAAHINLGYQLAWCLGEYHGDEALVQCRPLHVTRDGKRHYARDGSPDFGDFGIHHHKGYNYPKNDIGRSSAGCLVSRLVSDHLDFMKIIHTDARMKANRGMVWGATVLSASWVTTAAPPVLVTADQRPLISGLRKIFGGK